MWDYAVSTLCWQKCVLQQYRDRRSLKERFTLRTDMYKPLSLCLLILRRTPVHRIMPKSTIWWLKVDSVCYSAAICNWITSYFYTGISKWFLIVLLATVQPTWHVLWFPKLTKEQVLLFLCTIFLGSYYERLFMCHWSSMVDFFFCPNYMYNEMLL